MRNTDKVDTRDVGLKVGRILGQFFLKTDHLHYGYWSKDLDVCIENVPEAQRRYTDFLMENIPEGISTILDSGCGVGENAEILISKGYKVDCVSPSKYLSDITREKIGKESELFECFFEDIQTDKKYDMIFFSESFQYMKMDKTFENCKKLLNPGGYVFICDFFKIPGEGTSPMGGGHKLKKFYDVVGKYPFKQLKDKDITEFTAPNLDVVDRVLQDVAVPIYDIITEMMMKNYKFISRVGGFFANIFFKRRLEKLHYKYLSGERNAKNFMKFKTYRFFLYQLTDEEK